MDLGHMLEESTRRFTERIALIMTAIVLPIGT